MLICAFGMLHQVLALTGFVPDFATRECDVQVVKITQCFVLSSFVLAST